ncbi:MAG: WD40 repeat domain-containing protein [Saprospiraceae bacterium]|nr:WD40 repeat domain-containing protein [Saprospiraceae bacterium]HMW38394.1 WD40 repeat domain-containing protein [Saprospiraceae bacterium]HMX87289.1 WD40 repeat domain-containing protein [Saprospiraceae bacterium]HMZ39116.1 WD40 repeat domain-containing protein [Saprospiraceae bacterium]HNA63289.1 WD40 repeat domain-containing protein [Saprospiraceae bacterium]
MNINFHSQYSGHSAAVYCLTHGHVAGEFYSSGGDGIIVSWQLGKEDGKALANIGEPVFSLLHTPNWVFAGTQGGRLYRIDPQGQTAPRRMDFHRKSIHALLWLEDALYSASADGIIAQIAPEQFELIKALKTSPEGIRSMAWCKARKSIILGCQQGQIFEINTRLEHLQRIAYWPEARTIFGLAIPDEGNEILIGAMDARLRTFSFDNMDIMGEAIPAHQWTINDLIWIDELQILATASRDRSIRFWTRDPLSPITSITEYKYNGHHRSVNKLLWLKEKGVLLSGSDNQQVKAWIIE